MILNDACLTLITNEQNETIPLRRLTLHTFTQHLIIAIHSVMIRHLIGSLSVIWSTKDNFLFQKLGINKCFLHFWFFKSGVFTNRDILFLLVSV